MIEKTIKVGNIIRFPTCYRGYSNTPLLVKEVTTSFVYVHPIVRGIELDEETEFPKFCTLKNAELMTKKAICIPKDKINSLLEIVTNTNSIPDTIVIKYTARCRELRSTKFKVIQLYYGEQAVFIHYYTCSFAKRSDNSLVVILNNCTLCGK